MHESGRPEEVQARAILGRLLQVPVEQIDRRQGSSVHDLEIRWPNDPPWAVEVVTDTSPLSRSLLDALEKHGNTVHTNDVKRRWLIGLLAEERAPRTRLTRIKDELPPLLADVEGEGFVWFIRSYSLVSQAVREVVTRFPIWHGKALPTSDQPRIVFMPPTPMGSFTRRVGLVNEAVDKWASAEDVRRKLAESGAPERHVFIWVEEDSADLAWTLWDSEYPPSEPPIFPPEVTGAWIATGDAEAPVVWFADAKGGWKVLEGHRQVWPGQGSPEPPKPR